MFDVGFWEMLLLLALGLIILGPNKLPAVALKIGNYIGKARSLVNSFSRQMRQEIELEPKRPMVPKKTKPPSKSSQEELPLAEAENPEDD
jgi:sec-independent protein translocase protein TatB